MADPFRNTPGSDRPSWVLPAVVLGAVGLLVLVPILIGALSNSSPKGWLEDSYGTGTGDEDSSRGLLFHSDDSVDQTVAAIVTGTDPSEKRQEGQTHYLRYKSDWLVEVEDSPTGSGTDVRLFEFDAGYRSHGSTLFFWSSHYQQGGGLFRGGGSGSGK